MQSLTREQFASAIAKGLGRAYIHVRQYGDQHVRDILANACVHNLVYDTQCESSRADWIFSIIQLTGNPGFYESEVLKHLSTCESERDIAQMLDLSKQFAIRGGTRAKESIDEVFEAQLKNGSWLGASQIIDLDGIAGFVSVAERIGARLGGREACLEDFRFLEEAEDKFGADAVGRAIEERIRESDALREYVFRARQELGSLSEPISKEQRRQEVREKYPLYLRFPAIPEHYRAQYMAFGLYADDDDLRKLVSRLSSETREPQLLGLLWVFARRQMPEVTDRLLLLAGREDEIGQAARRALSHSSDARIHFLAREILKDPDLEGGKDSLELFTRNLQNDDIIAIEDFLNRIPPSAGDFGIHSIGHDLNDICSVNNCTALAGILLWTYENTPCMNCRQTAVELLIKSNSLPGDILNECRYDGDIGIRKMVEHLLEFNCC